MKEKWISGENQNAIVVYLDFSGKFVLIKVFPVEKSA